ncbi:invasion protein - outer membrane [Pseudomonas fluorescens WH6]|nr:invasion protein - outer membrane [Pseudomonas fluorescens WH6]
MYADFTALMLRLGLCRWLLFVALMLGNRLVGGATYEARDESLHSVFSALSVPLGVPVVVSREVARKRFTGVLELDAPQQALESLALQYGLIWYGDGQALYLYDASEAKSSAVALRHLSIDRFRNLMRRSGLDETRYPLRGSEGRTFYVSGPPNYVDQVLRLAQLMDRQRADLRIGSQAFGVVQVLNTHVDDREYVLGDQKVRVPGMASTIEALLVSEHKGPLADSSLGVIAYTDTNSLLIKGKPAQVKFIEQLVAQLDTPKRAIEVSLWLVDVSRDDMKKLDLARKKKTSASNAHILEPLEDKQLMEQITALERRRRARVVTLPVILTQENVPAVFEDNHTFYLPASDNDPADWKPVPYGAQVSVLPRIAEANQIEMLIKVEDGRQVREVGRRGKPTAVGRVSVSTVVRVPQGRRLWLGAFRRDVREQGEGTARNGLAEVRLFVLQARVVSSE